MVIAYDYEKLAYELYRQSDDLIEDLIPYDNPGT